MYRKIRKDRVALLIILTLVVIILAVSVIKYASGMIKVIIAERFAEQSEEPIELVQTDVMAVSATIETLLADTRVTFDQSMMLINTDRMLADDFEADVGEYNDSGVWMNTCVFGAYKDLSNAVRDEFSEKLYISSAYRTAAEQRRQLEEEGDTAQAVGASEHQAGLGLDVYVLYYGGKNFLNSDAGQWVNLNCWRCGFIIRYPYYGARETGISYEPWHIRYVGVPHAEYIMRNRLTLEGYFAKLTKDEFFSLKSGDDEYLVSRQEGESFMIPPMFESAVISPDNAGGYILTFKL